MTRGAGWGPIVQTPVVVPIEGRFCPVPVIGKLPLKLLPASTVMVSALAEMTGATSAHAAIATMPVILAILLVPGITQTYQGSAAWPGQRSTLQQSRARHSPTAGTCARAALVHVPASGLHISVYQSSHRNRHGS